jgi:hypothetical protein
MKYTIPDCGKGVNFDLLPSELEPGMWSSCTNYRFRSGFAELWEGLHLKYNDASNELSWITPYYTGATYYGVYLSPSAAFAYNATTGVRTTISPYTSSTAIASVTSVGTTVTVNTGTAHGRTTGDTIIAYGFVPTAYNGTYTVTVVDADTFTYTAGSAPGVSPPTVQGAYSLNSGNALSGGALGIRYTGGSFNGLCVVNAPSLGLFYWDGNTSNRLRRMPNFAGTSTFSVATAARPFKNFIVVLGKTENGVYKPQSVAWSNAVIDSGSIPTTFTAADTNQAGETNLTETQGAAVDCLPLGDANIVYMQDSYYAMQYIEGGDSVFSFTRLPGNEGLFASNCVVDTPAGHVFLTPSLDVRIHNGGESKSIASGRVLNAIRAYAGELATAGHFLCVNRNKNEVWVCLPASGEDFASRVFTWNYVDDTWGQFTTSSDNTSGLGHGAFGLYPSANGPVSDLWVLNYSTGTTSQSGICSAKEGAGKFLNVSLTGTLTREGLDVGDRDRMKTLQRSRWNIDGTGSATITHGSSKFADTAATYATGVTYTIASTDYCNARATQGRFIALSLSSSALSVNAKVRSIDLDVTPGGLR